jgi:hypothetical protein
VTIPFLIDSCMWYSIRVYIYSFVYSTVFLVPFIEETIFFPLCVFGTLVEDTFWVLCSVYLVYISVFKSLPYSFIYCSFVIYLGVRKYNLPALFLLCFAYSESPVVP